MIRYALIALLAGCAAPGTTYYKEGSTDAEFRADAGQCRAQAYSVPGAGLVQVSAVLHACMQGKGWAQR